MSTFAKAKQFLIHPTTKEVDEINDYTFLHYAKKWASHRNFFPVVRVIKNRELFVKLYYSEKLTYENRQLQEYCADYYREMFPKLSFEECTYIGIPFKPTNSKQSILNSNSIHELEAIYLNTLEDDSYINCAEPESNPDGGGTTYYMTYLPRLFKHWDKLINEGYLEPEYEKKCQVEILDEHLGIDNTSTMGKASLDITDKFKVEVFMKTGGEQPQELIADTINKFFIGNYAKVWAMTRGFTSTFKSYNNGEISFDMITDPRCKEHDFLLARFIASEYKNKVALLKDATSFDVHHFKANDIIGYNLQESEWHLFQSYDERVKESYNTLGMTASLIHHGRL
jgi:hypothetical protein